MSRFAKVLATLAAAGVVAGCGVPVGSGPARIDPSTVPYGLLNESGTAAPDELFGRAVPIFLVDRDRLVSVTRHVNGSNVAQRSLGALLLGPTAIEASRGYRTAIPPDVRLISLDYVGDKTASVDLTPAFGAISGSDQVLAVAQIVYTLTASSHIRAVVFAVADKPVAVPDGDGTLDTAPRTRADYRAQAPRQGDG